MRSHRSHALRQQSVSERVTSTTVYSPPYPSCPATGETGQHQDGCTDDADVKCQRSLGRDRGLVRTPVGMEVGMEVVGDLDFVGAPVGAADGNHVLGAQLSRVTPA